jgi:hypothetical protein
VAWVNADAVCPVLVDDSESNADRIRNDWRLLRRLVRVVIIVFVIIFAMRRFNNFDCCSQKILAMMTPKK